MSTEAVYPPTNPSPFDTAAKRIQALFPQTLNPNSLNVTTQKERAIPDVWIRSLDGASPLRQAFEIAYPSLFLHPHEVPANLDTIREVYQQLGVMAHMPNTCFVPTSSLSEPKLWEELKQDGVTHCGYFGTGGQVIKYYEETFGLLWPKVRPETYGMILDRVLEITGTDLDEDEIDADLIFPTCYNESVAYIKAGKTDFKPAFVFVIPSRAIERQEEGDWVGNGAFTVNELANGLYAIMKRCDEWQTENLDITKLPSVIFAIAGPADYADLD